jgi:serine protease Do
VVDLQGKAVGINIARAGRTESYAIPAEVVQGLLSDLKSGKLAPKDDGAERVAELEKALKRAQTDALKAEEQLGSATAAKKKDLQKKLDELKKKVDEAQAALDKARKDRTKK